MFSKIQMCEGLRWNYNNNYYKQNNLTTIDWSNSGGALHEKAVSDYIPLNGNYSLVPHPLDVLMLVFLRQPVRVCWAIFFPW